MNTSSLFWSQSQGIEGSEKSETVRQAGRKRPNKSAYFWVPVVG